MTTAAQILAELQRCGVNPQGIRADSRQIRPGDVFVALPGLRSDGRTFIQDALTRGAVAVLAEAEGGAVRPAGKVPFVEVENLALLAGELAHLIYNRPSQQLRVFGVTGTNGKTTVSQWIAQAYRLLGRRCGVIGTLGSGFPDALQESANTTPDAMSLHATLAGLQVAGAEACAMEVSSIGLDQQRTQAIAFDVAIFTNLTRDHLEYHGDMERYAAAKARLFAAPGLRVAVLNLDDAFGRSLASQLAGKGVRRIGYTLDPAAPYAQLVDELLCAETLQVSGSGLNLELRCSQGAGRISTAVLGRFNAENLLALMGALLAAGISLVEAVQVLPQLVAPPGRLQVVPRVAPGAVAEPLVVVDYAHTPDALRQVLATLREVAMARDGRLICVFGCGGERDPGKRPLMGQVVAELADAMLVTSDNPRGEDPRHIIDAILAGIAGPVPVEIERAAAIRRAVVAADNRDVVLLAGKGHEPYQEIAGQRLPFSDLQQARTALQERAKVHTMMNLQEAALAVGGRVVGDVGGSDAGLVGISTDSRSIAAGELFIALRGERFDGHAYVESVLAQGAAAALVDEAWIAQQVDRLPCGAYVVAADTRLALGALAAHWRRKFSLPLIGVTGSNGKTTVKEMCAAILRAQARLDGLAPADAQAAVLATSGNLNNDIGLPMMLLRLRTGQRAAVIEMGMNHPGEIDYLTRLAAPTVALVNNAQRAHLAGLGSLTGVACAKGEIFSGLQAGGTAVINADDPQAGLWRQMAREAGAQNVLDFGLDSVSAKVRASCQSRALGSHLHLVTPQGECQIELQVPGRHNASNALAAAAATLAAGASLPAVKAGLDGYVGVKGRLQQRQTASGALLIDDTYNANPDSMRAAIDVLASLPGQRIFVLGDMGEVGEQAGQCHDEIGGYAKSMGVDRLLALGDHAAAAVRNFGADATHYRNIGALIEALRPLLNAEATVLVKGSRFMQMERVADALAQEDKQ